MSDEALFRECAERLRCVTHHHACECREAAHATLLEQLRDQRDDLHARNTELVGMYREAERQRDEAERASRAFAVLLVRTEAELAEVRFILGGLRK